MKGQNIPMNQAISGGVLIFPCVTDGGVFNIGLGI
jgi:hypothetical protein